VRIRDVLAEHQYQEWNYGDGYTEPQEWGSGCTCNVVYDQHIQHACSDDCSCRTADPVSVPEAHLQHVLAMLIRARLLRSDRIPDPRLACGLLLIPDGIKPDDALEPWMRAVAQAIPDGAEVITSVPRQWGGTPVRTDERLGVISDVPLDPADDRPF
jgi:hypothetical protein